jgi:hypothetical protein
MQTGQSVFIDSGLTTDQAQASLAVSVIRNILQKNGDTIEFKIIFHFRRVGTTSDSHWKDRGSALSSEAVYPG